MINERHDVDLSGLNTFGIGARCERMIEFTDSADLRDIFSRPDIAREHWDVLGGGSNILLTGDFHGTLLKHAGSQMTITSLDSHIAEVRVDAGVVWDDFVQWAVDHDFWGAENLSGIPGTVGAAPVQNIGAYGVEAKDIICSVEAYDVLTGKVTTLASAHCGFGYRDSIFKRMLKGRTIITAVNFALGLESSPRLDYGDLLTETESAGGATLSNIRAAVMSIRDRKLPDPHETGNAGSFFKNPVVTQTFAEKLKSDHPSIPLYPSGIDGTTKLAAGWLIDSCGWKGRSLGRAGVHPRQALVLVNLGGATGHDILTLARRIREDVHAAFGVDLEMEVNVW